MGLLERIGLEKRGYTADVISLLENAAASGIEVLPETPAIEFAVRSFSTATGAPATFSPVLLADICRDLLTKRHGFAGLITVQDGAAAIERSSAVSVRNNGLFDLTFPNRSLKAVSPAQVFQVRHSAKGSPMQTNPELVKLYTRLLRALADEAGGPLGSIVALGSRESKNTKGVKISVADRLKNLRGGLATFLSPPSGAGGGSGSSVFQPKPWCVTRLGANPPDSLVSLIKQIDRQMANAIGVPASLLGDGGGTGQREAMRVFLSTTLRPFARLVEYEIKQKLNETVQLKFPGLIASDIASRARAFKSLTEAGIEKVEAMKLVGFEE